MASEALMNDLLLSDLHKDLYGFRPGRMTWARWSEMTDADLVAEYERMAADLDVQIENERQRKNERAVRFEAMIAKLMADHGIDRDTAIRWDIQAEEAELCVEQYGMDYYEYLKGLPYGYFTQNATSAGGTL